MTAAPNQSQPATEHPARGTPQYFCEWLRGFLSAGRDELDAFDANTIRAELAAVFPPSPPEPHSP